VYPVGRLDYESEGLLILTNDASLNNRLLHPKNAHEREYWVQVEGIPSKEAIQQLQKGVVISVNNKPYTTQPCKASLFKEAPCVPLREPPIRERKHISTAWLQLILQEGKNRQVRKMTAKVGFPTLRLIRYRIEKLTIENMQPGDVKEISKETIYKSFFH
jgi:23S rRNA pseudouridine2457 synthase